MEITMYTKIKMVYWKGEKYWLGKISNHFLKELIDLKNLF